MLRMLAGFLAIPARNDLYVYVVDRLASRSTIELLGSVYLPALPDV